MSTLVGKVGCWELDFKKSPSGESGSVNVDVKGHGVVTVRWKADANGIWISHTDLNSAHGGGEVLRGYDVEGERDDDGAVQYHLYQRGGGQEWIGLSLLRAGQGESSGAQAGKKKGVRVRSQMPGKIVRIEVKPGATVEKGDALLVMEAMKMENIIRAPQAGVIAAVKVQVGQAVETGADLATYE
jgi:acetyl/propionyl-CoA carboxylase alpha subunit